MKLFSSTYTKYSFISCFFTIFDSVFSWIKSDGNDYKRLKLSTPYFFSKNKAYLKNKQYYFFFDGHVA